MLKAIAGKAGYAVGCIFASFVLVTSGFAYYVQSKAESLGGSNAISGSPSTGAMNILVMGLESRTYWDGEAISRTLEDQMHIGSIGGNTTNTLILIHIFAGGTKAVGFSIPRDDWVNMVGTDGYGGAQGKIDQAFGFAKANEQNKLVASGQAAKMNTDQLASATNTAGESAAIQTVEALTGVTVNHFVALNLIGFYELAQTFGGVEVCLTHATSDLDFSGANFKAGYQFLDPAQALAFVRQRENLPNGDLDRTHRQQAVIDYVIWKLKHQGILADIGQVNQLLDVAKKYVITDDDWNLLQFAGEMQALTGKNLTFQTLPIEGYATEDGQSANLVNPAALKQIVHNAFYPPPAKKKAAAKSTAKTDNKSTSLAPAATTVDVYNGGNTGGLAGAISQALTTAGFKAGTVGNIATRSATEVLYGAGAAASAAKIAGYFDGVAAVASTSVAAGQVEVLLGTDATSVPAGIGSSSSPSPTPTPSTSGVPAGELQGNGASGGAVTVKPNAPYGIPCVD
jgi:LCP family protein required for cell wall assembly